MTQRKPQRAAPARKQPESMAPLRRALCRQKKVELVDTLLELAQTDRVVLRGLTARFDLAAAPDELVAATRQAIADATAVDKRDINCNFDYDDRAYNEVQRNLSSLIGLVTAARSCRWLLELDEARELPGRDERRRSMTGDIEDGVSLGQGCMNPFG